MMASSPLPASATPFVIALAQHHTQVRAAQRLRQQVLNSKHLPTGLSLTAVGNVESDYLDRYCEHLLVRETTHGEVIATARLLGPEQAQKLGGYAAEENFDLIRLLPLRERLVEISHVCIHPDFQQAATVRRLWQGVRQYLHMGRYDYLMGSVSVGIADGGHVAASVYHRLQTARLAPIEWRVLPRYALPLHALNQQLVVRQPAWVKRYQHAGAYLCGEPAWDAHHNSAELLMLLPLLPHRS